MAIDKEKLLIDVKTFVGVGDNTWRQDRMGAGPTKKLVEFWLERHIDTLAGGYSWGFMQRNAKTSGLTVNTAAGDKAISLSSDGLYIKLPEEILAVNSGKIGDSFLTFQRLDDIQLQKYEDGGSRIFCSISHLRDDNESVPILLFTTSQTGNDVHLVITEHPQSIENFPRDFTGLFRQLLIKDALMMEGSANTGGILQMLSAEIPQMIKDLKSKYAAKMEPVLVRETPHQQDYRSNMVSKAGR